MEWNQPISSQTGIKNTSTAAEPVSCGVEKTTAQQPESLMKSLISKFSMRCNLCRIFRLRGSAKSLVASFARAGTKFEYWAKP